MCVTGNGFRNDFMFYFELLCDVRREYQVLCSKCFQEPNLTKQGLSPYYHCISPLPSASMYMPWLGTVTVFKNIFWIQPEGFICVNRTDNFFPVQVYLATEKITISQESITVRRSDTNFLEAHLSATETETDYFKQRIFGYPKDNNFPEAGEATRYTL